MTNLIKKTSVILVLNSCILLSSCTTVNFADFQLEHINNLHGETSQAYQGMTIYENKLVSVQNQGYATIYELPSMTKTSPTFKMGCFSDKNHANVASFGTEKYEKNDSFPLLYISQSWKVPINGIKDICYVERLNPKGNSQLVQRIILDDPEHLYGYALQWTIDKTNNRLIGFGNTISNKADENKFRIVLFNLPKIKDGNIIHLHAIDAIDNYVIQDFDNRYPSKVIGQGACVYKGCLIMPTGTGNKNNPSIIYVWNLKKKTLKNILDLRGQLDKEMEDIDFYKGNAYIQTNGMGMVMLKYKK